MALPPPIDGTQQYLAAIHDRLGELLDRIPEPPDEQQADGTVELREPQAATSTDESGGPGLPQRPASRPRKPTTRTKKGA